MPIIEGWEISPDCVGMYEKIASTEPLGSPIITSKCKLREVKKTTVDYGDGFLIVGENGLVWRRRAGVDITGLTYLSSKKWRGKWIRWHDIANIVPTGYGETWVHIKKRKDGAILLDKKGNYKVIKWKLTLNRNKLEEKTDFKQRRINFGDIMLDVFKQKRVEIDPPSSDSRM